MGVRDEGVSVFCRRRVAGTDVDGRRAVYIRRERVGEIEEAHCPAGTMIYLSKLKALSLNSNLRPCTRTPLVARVCVGFLSPCREESARVQGS